MNFRQTLPVSYLLFTYRGRIGRYTYWLVSLFIWSAFYVLHTGAEALGDWAHYVVYILLFWSITATGSKRLHDHGRKGYWLLLVLIPVFGAFWLLYWLGFKAGNPLRNRYGLPPGAAADYFRNGEAKPDPEHPGMFRVNDVTQLNPIAVARVEKPESVEALCALLRDTEGPVSIGGGRFSMGGQTASPGSLHIDMRGLNKILHFDKEKKTIDVEAGIRWCDIQRHIDPHGLSVKIMQTYANFTVGGALSVNAHGRYIGQGPLILSVRWIEVALADGRLVRASRTENSDILFGAVGCYNAIGVIVRVGLDLADNVLVERVHQKMPRSAYSEYFHTNVRQRPEQVFHNGDIFPPTFQRVRAVSWVTTNRQPTEKTRLMPLKDRYPIERYFLWAMSRSRFGKWRREFIVEPLLYLRKRVHWRNYEAGYDVAELEPKSREDRTYVLQEYFVPVARFMAFSDRMAEIFIRHNANVINVSIRHAEADPGSLLAWAREEVFAFVVYYQQETNPAACHAVAVWTRELIEAVLASGGTYYLPYQPHATQDQFERAYPDAHRLFELKQRLDPQFRFRNGLWNKYYQPTPVPRPAMPALSEFKAVFSDTGWSDAFYRFLQVVYHLYPEDRFHYLIKTESQAADTDQAIYRNIQGKLGTIKPFLQPVTYGLPALKVQKREMTRQALELLGDKRIVNGYVEIGSTGRYISEMRKHLAVSGPIYLVNSLGPSYSLGDIFERGQIGKLGTFVKNEDYTPLDRDIAPGSIDLVTCFVGLHHARPEMLGAFVKSIHTILRPGGRFILRDHDVKSPEMATFVSLVHTVFNLGLDVPWDEEVKDYKDFKSIEEWSKLISGFGFRDSGRRLLQANDPSDNTLICFTKEA